MPVAVADPETALLTPLFSITEPVDVPLITAISFSPAIVIVNIAEAT